MDFLAKIVTLYRNAISGIIERTTGWRPGSKTKSFLEWTGAGTGAVLGVWGIFALIGGGGQVTKDDIEKLRVELRQVLLQKESEANSGLSNKNGLGIARDLDSAIDTLRKAGKSQALKDKTGRRAVAALDELITHRKKVRELIAKDEAELWRQKGALAFLHDTDAALNAYAKATQLDPDNVDAWIQLGLLLERIGELDGSIATFEHVLAIGEARKDNVIIALATNNLGTVYLTRGDLDKAEQMLMRSLAIEQMLDRKEGIADSYGNLGLLYSVRGKLDMAEDMHTKALDLHQALKDTEGIANGYANLGNIYARRGDLDKAQGMYLKSLGLFEILNYQEKIATTYGNIASIHLTRGDLDKAQQNYQKSIEINETLDHKKGMARDYGNMGIVHKKRGEFNQAEQWYLRALALYTKMDSQVGLARTYENLGLLDKARGKSPDACTNWTKARTLYAKIDSPEKIKKLEGLMAQAICSKT